ncbi:hypothetical protein [Actinomadura litoris]|uniref:hypothetical protein n=1 Tax=Actinomadura litoris TaxID=2678616 RepID=UPI001FA71AD9|nr:hypothetical protein [Actinomadura litoris]
MTEHVTHHCQLPGVLDSAPARPGDLVVGHFPEWPHLDGMLFRIMSVRESDDGLRYGLIDPANGATLVRDIPGRWITPVTLTWRQFHNKPPWNPRHQVAELRGLRAQVAPNEDGTWRYVVAPMTKHNPIAYGSFTEQEAKDRAQAELLEAEIKNAIRAGTVPFTWPAYP